jgi:hypothetical protein
MTFKKIINNVNTINTTMAKIKNDIQENHQQYVPPQPAQEQPPPPPRRVNAKGKTK